MESPWIIPAFGKQPENRMDLSTAKQWAIEHGYTHVRTSGNGLVSIADWNPYGGKWEGIPVDTAEGQTAKFQDCPTPWPMHYGLGLWPLMREGNV